MDSSMIQENIEEYVNDENKIVTYRWLSLTLNINVNQAKQALYSFATYQRNNGDNDDINVTYFVAGLGQSKDGQPLHKCVVVPESHLDVVKSELNPVTSCHVYSVQKAKLKDTTALYQTDYDVIKENLTVSPSLSSIVCPWAVMRDIKPSQSSKNIKSSAIEPPKTSTVKVEAGGTTSEGAASKAKKKTEAKGNIASMFASAGKKGGENGQKSNVAEKTQTNKQKNKPAEKKGGMMAFFSAQQKDQTAEKSSSKSAVPAKTVEKKESPPKKIVEKKESPIKKQKEKSSRKNMQNDDSDDEVPQKRSRRRIKTDLFDSSDEDERNSEAESEREEEHAHNTAILDDDEEDDPKEETKSEEEAEPHPEPEPVKEEITEGNRKRKRKRKLVPKQYVDEEGFMVTEKVWESDSTDASDNEVVKKSEEKAKQDFNKAVDGKPKSEPKSKPPPKKSASPQKGKQTSLMSFFKKK